MSEDEDVFICDQCDDIFLSKSGLDRHIEEEHVAKKKTEVNPEKEKPPVEEKTEDVKANGNGKRSRSPSKERGEAEVKKKKVRIGPASRVKRPRSSSEETEPEKVNPQTIPRILDNPTETKVHKPTEREEHKKDKEGDRERHNDKESSKHKKKHKDRDRDRERDKEEERRRRRAREKEEARKRLESTEKRVSAESSDDEEKNRRRSEKARAEWMRKNDLARGKEAKYKSSGMDDFIVDDYQEKPKVIKHRSENRLDSEKTSLGSSGGFASQGTVKAHDNESGPECFKCGQICKDNSNLKNHVLSHYYQVFYEVLPDSKPFPCPECGNTSRDRITLVRHYAFTHKKLFEMTEVEPEHIAGFGNRKSVKRRMTTESSAPSKRNLNGEKVKKIDFSKIVDTDSEEEDVEEKIKQMKSKYLKVSDGDTKHDRTSEEDRRREHKKHKKHKHKDHKHKKEKKHKKDRHHDREKEDRHRDREKEDRHRDREKERGPVVNPLGSLLKDLSPDSSTSGRSQSRAPPDEDLARTETAAEIPTSPVSPRNEEAEEKAEESDDLLDDDFATPVFA